MNTLLLIWLLKLYICFHGSWLTLRSHYKGYLPQSSLLLNPSTTPLSHADVKVNIPENEILRHQVDPSALAFWLTQTVYDFMPTEK